MLPTAGAVRESRVGVAGTHLLVQLGLPSELAVRLAGAGEVTVRPRLSRRTSAAGWPGGSGRDQEMVALDFGGEAARLFLEARLAVGIVNAVLGLRPPPFAGPLTRIERGVLTGALAALVAELGLTPGIVIGGVPAPDDSWREAIEFSVGLGANLGYGCLTMSDGFLDRVGRAWVGSAVPLEPRIDLATTTIAPPDLVSAASGDQVVFDETPALPANEDWPVQARCAANRASAWWLPDGRLLAREDPPGGDATLATRPEGVTGMARGSVKRDLVETSVRVVAGYDGLSVDADRGPGLMVARDAPVVLEVGGQPWAYGVLGQVAGALAVTITRRLEA